MSSMRVFFTLRRRNVRASRGCTPKLHNMFSFHTTPGEIKNILDQKQRNLIIFKTLRFQNVSLHTKIQSRHFEIPLFWRTFLKSSVFVEDSECGLSISFPEPTCLLVSTKTRSSGIINKLVARALVSFAFKIWYCGGTTVLSKPNFDFPTFSSAYIQCLWGTYPHRLYL